MILGGSTKISGYQPRPLTVAADRPRFLTKSNTGVGLQTSPKAGHFVKVPKTRPTRKVCQERVACKGPRRDATFHCEQCDTLQCELCEALIHENPRFVFHDRTRLPIPNKDHLCQHACELRNLADIYCNQCRKRLCFTCEVALHHVQFKNHKRIPFEADDFFSLPNLDSELPVEEPTSYFSVQETDSLDSKDSFSSVFEGTFDSINKTTQSRKSLDLFDGHGSLKSVENFNSVENPDSFKSIPDSKMLSLESITVPDVASVGSNNIYQIIEDSRRKSKQESSFPKSFLLIDDRESLKVDDEDDFVKALGCKKETTVKVVSIFGNTGAGKSHTLNHTFFNGKEVFQTSSTQISCTIGVWIAYDPVLNVMVLDTEGLLGSTSNQHQRTRLLLKVLAVSDIVIYRTNAERLQNDLFSFLGDASKAYSHHFSHELKAASKRFNFEGPLSSLGPAVIVFQETLYTDVLAADKNKPCEEILKKRFRELDLSIDAFCAIQYVGVKTSSPPTCFEGLSVAIKKQLENLSVRSAREICVVFKALKVLNDKFSGNIEKTVPSTFPDQYFTCNAACLSCDARCASSMNHTQDGIAHSSSSMCRYQHQHDNKIYVCQACYQRGETVVVTPKTSASSESAWFGIAKFAWAGYVLECTNCGVIYRSRQYWYGNKDPWETAVRTEICHIWPGINSIPQNNQNAARRVIDSVSYISDTISYVSAKPTKTLTSWVADQIAPSYWKPNYAITECNNCQKPFEESDKKHHCRACGNGFCDECSSKTKPVPERGWGATPVRVCDKCFDGLEDSQNESQLKEEAVTVRKVGEVLHSAIGTVASAIDYPLVLIKDTARPTYWTPDDQIKECTVCKNSFSPKLALHHCRGCGQGVCDPCSEARLPVCSRGWDYPVRVCKTCEKRKDL